MAKRVFLIVLDSVGIGAMPDAGEWGDEGSNTLASIRKSPVFSCPNLEKFGLFAVDGVGENTPCVRKAICENMQYLGLEIDEDKNQEKNNGAIRDITGANSKVKVLIIPTNEELVIARETVELL